MKRSALFYVCCFISIFCMSLFSCSRKNNLNKIVNDDSSTMKQSIDENGRKVDVDLSKLSATMVYAEVFNMLIAPDEYNGKIIRVKGIFNSFIPNGKIERAFTVVVSDALACCQQGIEFKFSEAKRCPEDFPPLNSEIEIIGKFVMTQTLEGYDYFYILCDGITSL